MSDLIGWAICVALVLIVGAFGAYAIAEIVYEVRDDKRRQAEWDAWDAQRGLSAQEHALNLKPPCSWPGCGAPACREIRREREERMAAYIRGENPDE